MERHKLFEGMSKLKPLCDALRVNPTIEMANRLKSEVEQVSSGVVQDLQGYILPPLLIHLSTNDITKDVKLHFVNCLRVVISKTYIRNVNLLKKIFSTLTYQIFDKNEKSMVIQLYEELKESVLLCIQELMHKGCTDVVESFYVRPNVTLLGQTIYICISIAKLEKSQTLRLAAIATMMTLTYVHDQADSSDLILRSQIADIVMLLFPGIIIGLQETALSSEIQGHKIPMMALRATGRILTLVMEDGPEQQTKSDFKSLAANKVESSDPLGVTQKARDGMLKYMETATRTVDWLNAAASKLNVCIKAFNSLGKHSHLKVRKELAEFVGILLRKCSRNMKPNHRDLVEILIMLSEDDAQQVSTSATAIFDELRKKYSRGNQAIRPIIEELEESFYTLLTKLPRVIRTSDQSEQMSCLNCFGGYLKILGPERLPKIMSSVPHLQRLILSLVYTIELDCSNISLLEDTSIKDSENIIHHHGFDSWRHFKFLNDSLAERKIQNICRLIGEFGDLKILTDTILDMLSNMSRYRKELVLLLAWIISVPVKETSDFSEYQSIVEYFVTPNIWNLPLHVTSQLNLGEAQSNVVQCCIFLEVLENIARTMQKEYQRFLLQTLCLVIERAGSRQTLVSIAGFKALSSFAEATGVKSVEDLLKSNIDYLSYHISLKLRRVERNPGVLDVVTIVTKQCSLNLLPFLEEIVQDVLSQSNLNYQERNSYSFLKVFHTFVTCVQRLVKSEISDSPMMRTEVVDDAETVIRDLLEYWNAKQDSKIDNVDESNNDDDISNMDSQNLENYKEEKKAPIPLHIRLTVSIMRRCIHFLPNTDVSVKLLAIDTLQAGVLILKDFEDELLPIVHQLWHPLVHRFRDTNPIVINRAWGLLHTLAYVSRDFIRSRTLKEVIPALSEFLSKSAKESYKKDSGNAYKFTQVFKLQRELLSRMGDVINHIQLQERQLWDILESAVPYLSKYQHSELQVCCVTLFKKIAKYNRDLVWVKCLSIIPANKNVEYASMSSSIKVTNFNIQNEYQVNIETIMTYIDDKTFKM